MEENTIKVYEQSIEALENGKIAINGKELESVHELEIALNLLIKAVISIVKGRWYSMNERVKELLNRKPNKWGNVDIKTFEQDIKLLQETIVSQQEKIDIISDIRNKIKEILQ